MSQTESSGLIDAVRALRSGDVLLRALPPGLEPAVHLVGGAVRDLLLERTPTGDLDLVAEGPAGAVLDAIGGRARLDGVREHERFGTVTLTLDGCVFDIVSARRERYPRPGALPEVEPGTLEDDLLRRDFTVNALALALTGPTRGRLRAAPAALEHLRRGMLSVLHDRSFEDDPTRLLRLARYRARLGFEISRDTLTLALDALGGGALDTLSGPRIGNELRALAREDDPVVALGALAELGVDAAIDVDFGLISDDRPLAARALELLPGDGRADLEALAVAARRMSATRLAELMDRLAFEAPERDVVVTAATCSEALARRLMSARRPSEIGAAVAGGGVELVALAGALGAPAPAQAWIEQLRHRSLEIDGRDLIAAGIRQGPAVGAGLRAALASMLDGEANERERQLEIAVRAAQRTG